MKRFFATMQAAVAVIAVVNLGTIAQAHDRPPTGVVKKQSQIAGRIEWGIWVDADGCMHWWSDGGQEGYMVDRVNPMTGKPVCLKRTLCLSESADNLFSGDGAELTAAGQRKMAGFFQNKGAVGYEIIGHTDDSGSESDNEDLSQSRASAVALVARASGAMVEREIGAGELYPVASNSSAAGMQKNRRIDVICYEW